MNNEPTRYYVRVKFNSVKEKYKTLKDIIEGPEPGCIEGMIRIRDINGVTWEWPKEIVDEIKVYPQLEKVKEEEEDDEHEHD